MGNEIIRIGEVVESTTTSFVSQCYRLYDSPHLGTIVKTGGPYPALGLVYNITTQGIDPSRKPVARGIDNLLEDDVYRINPQLEQLLRTDFFSITIGYVQDENIMCKLPPNPPPIYSFVEPCDDNELLALSSDLSFIKVIVNSGLPASDELIATIVNELANHKDSREDFLITAGKMLLTVFPGDFRKMEYIIGKVQS